ncbi:lytic transglycosylase domain-containing protein [Salmonella enterica]|nr:lytic transglycosylase domain-containing protein [Salmonella enterica]EEP3372982.1 lytic transglycosylase domain-containing protein [Salmonella enterica]EFP6579689.1 lytic transglycosylase domain-containing protein [Salmonella enterica]EGC7970971.1 lytic transglycosylase domain-containing protein [Salmonella enterica]EIV4461154.1 lytic transglycosylase domain-containing protein [Salmonella enterica]
MISYHLKIVIFLFLVSSSVAFSNAHAFCFKEAGERYSVDPLLLIAIAQTESSLNPQATNINRRGTAKESIDIGLMQINSVWFNQLSSEWGISKQDLIKNPCQNVYVGAYILALNIKKNGVNWKSIGAYNAGFSDKTEAARIIYAKKVYNFYVSLLAKNREFVIANASKGVMIK